MSACVRACMNARASDCVCVFTRARVCSLLYAFDTDFNASLASSMFVLHVSMAARTCRKQFKCIQRIFLDNSP